MVYGVTGAGSSMEYSLREKLEAMGVEFSMAQASVSLAEDHPLRQVSLEVEVSQTQEPSLDHL